MADTDGEPNLCVVSRDCNKNQNKTTTSINRILWENSTSNKQTACFRDVLKT